MFQRRQSAVIRLYIEVQRLSSGDGRVLREAERLGRELGVRLVATNNVYFLRPEEHLHHRAVNAIRTGGLLTTVAPPEITTAEAWRSEERRVGKECRSRWSPYH